VIGAVTTQPFNLPRKIISRLATVKHSNVMALLKQCLDNRGTKVSCATNDERAHLEYFNGRGGLWPDTAAISI
jgi:hypothetical protein